MTVQLLIDKASEKVGNRYKLAKALGVAPSQVYDWRESRKPCSPADRARIAAFAGEDAVQELVRATLEQAQGDVRREQLMRVLGKSLHQTGAVALSAMAGIFSLICGTNLYQIRCILC